MHDFSTTQQNPLRPAGFTAVMVPVRPALPRPVASRPVLSLPVLPVPAVSQPAVADDGEAPAVEPVADELPVIDLRAGSLCAGAAGQAGPWRTVHVVDVENLLGAGHRTATIAQIQDVIDAYRKLVDAREGDLFFYGANPRLRVRVILATGSNQVRGYTGKDGADRALLDVVSSDWVVGQFDRVCIASGDHAFAPLARSLGSAGLHVTVVSRPMSVHADLYVASTEHLVLGPELAAA